MVKKNIGFFITITLFVFIFILGIVLLFLKNSEENKVTKLIKRSESSLVELLENNPSLNQENELESEKNISHLKQIYERKIRLVESRDPILTETDDNRFLGSVRDHYQKLRALCKPSEQEENNIKIPEDFGFGFDVYVKQGAITDEMKPYVSQMDKQRQLIEYLSKSLINTQPDGITSIKREYVEFQGTNAKEKSSASDSYEIPSQLSVKKEGVVNTLAFELTFYGHTSSLRGFLNSLSDAPYPFIVQNIRVKSASKKEIEESAFKAKTITKVVKKATPDNAFAALFGISDKKEEKEEIKETEVTVLRREPIIKEDASTFTVVIEYIDYTYDIEKQLGELSNQDEEYQDNF